MKTSFHFPLESPGEYRLFFFSEVQIMIYNTVLGLSVQYSDGAFFKRLYSIES